MATIRLTDAEIVSARLDDDGLVWTERCTGLSLFELAAQLGAVIERHPRKPDTCRILFQDDSIITTSGDAWDFGHPDCWCWQDAGHADDCVARRSAV